MKRAVPAVALAMLIAACGGAGGVVDTPPASVFTTTGPLADTTPAPANTSTTLVASIDEAEVSELELVLDEIENLVADTEKMIDEPLP